MIFGGSNAICSKRQHKVRYREACAAKTAVPSFLSWSESPITFDQRDHPSHVTRPGRYPLLVKREEPGHHLNVQRPVYFVGEVLTDAKVWYP